MLEPSALLPRVILPWGDSAPDHLFGMSGVEMQTCKSPEGYLGALPDPWEARLGPGKMLQYRRGQKVSPASTS